MPATVTIVCSAMGSTSDCRIALLCRPRARNMNPSNERPSRPRRASVGWLFGLGPSPQAVHAARQCVLLLRWIRTRRNLRLASGLVLFTYVTFHLSCHALGLISVETAEAGLRATVRLWHSWPGTTLLYGAAGVHIGLALLAIYDRRTLRMAPLNGLRIVLGLLMPLSLIGHFVGTRYAFEHFGLHSEYSRIAANLWSGGAQGLTLGLLAPGWLHGCLGLRFAFGHRRLWGRFHMELFGVALLLPVLAGLGFVAMGRALEEQRAGVERQASPNGAERRALDDMRNAALETYLALIGLVALARVLRDVNERRRMSVVHIVQCRRESILRVSSGHARTLSDPVSDAHVRWVHVVREGKGVVARRVCLDAAAVRCHDRDSGCRAWNDHHAIVQTFGLRRSQIGIASVELCVRYGGHLGSECAVWATRLPHWNFEGTVRARCSTKTNGLPQICCNPLILLAGGRGSNEGSYA